jgi:sugar-specific transcriptional regulator TrmB
MNSQLKIETVLEKLGFSPNEIKIYLKLNDNGPQKAGNLAKMAKIDRSSCYNSLKILLEKGLLSYAIKDNVKLFQSCGPKRLLDYVKEQEQDVSEIIPELHARHKAVKEDGQVRLFKGIKGVKTVFLDIIRNGEDNYAFGSEGQFTKRMPEFALQFLRLKKENNIKTKMIVRQGRTEKHSIDSEHRYLNVEESPAVTNIYGKKVAIIIWTQEPEAIIIENESVAKAFKSYFDVMWKDANKTSKKK